MFRAEDSIMTNNTKGSTTQFPDFITLFILVKF